MKKLIAGIVVVAALAVAPLTLGSLDAVEATDGEQVAAKAVLISTGAKAVLISTGAKAVLISTGAKAVLISTGQS